MPDIFQDFPVRADPSRVFEAISAPTGLEQWWTKSCTGQPNHGAIYQLGFGPEHQWRATVSQCVAESVFELTLEEAHPDWLGTRVRFELSPSNNGTMVRFSHLGWPAANEHYRVSCHCWALYLRCLRRYLEHAEFVPYEARLDA